MLGEEKFEIAPGKTEVLELNLDRGERISYYAYAEVDGVKRWLQRNTFHFNPNKHTKFFIYQVPTTDESVKVKSKAITEFQR